MVRPSKPRLMARVLDAVANLGDTRGSSAREVLSFIRHSDISFKNLTLQVHRALKHAVNAGLLRHRSGRYKILATLNPNSISNSLVNKEPATDNQKNEEKESKFDEQASIGDTESSCRTQKRKKKTISRRRNSRHRSGKTTRKSRRSPYTSRSNDAPNRKRRHQKHIYEDEQFEDQSIGQYILQRRDNSPVSFSRRMKRSKVSKRKLESDFSDESDCNNDMSRKRISRVNKSLYQEAKRKETRAKSRSRSRVRSPLEQVMQMQQGPIEEIKNRQQCKENCEFMKYNVAYQEAHTDVERVHDSNDSKSVSTLENMRD